MHQPRSTMNTAAVGAPLRHPAFQRLWLGLSISYLGDQFTIIALLWFVLQLTGSGAAVGLVILCFDLPGVVTGAILGRLLDRYQPRLVMGFDNLARAASGDRYLWPRLHPRRAGWPRLTVTASVATRKPLVFRQGMNTDSEIWATWMGSFPSIRVHLRSSVAKNKY